MYLTYEQALDEIRALPARVDTVGSSILGEPMLRVQIGPEDAEKVGFLLAGIHATEWIGVHVALETLRRLAADPPTDRCIVAMPLLNPDGYRLVHEDRVAGRWRFRRTNANGVDLNRNWPTHYSPWKPLGRLLPFLGTSGPHPCSEPEIAAAVQQLDRVKDRVDRAMSMHSFGRMILLPWGGRLREPPGIERLREAGERLAIELDQTYTVVQVSRWVPGLSASRGMELDHIYEVTGAISLLIECEGGFSWGDPSTWSDLFSWWNPAEPGPVVADLSPVVASFLNPGA